MSARRKYNRRQPRRITVRGVRLAEPDLNKLSRVLIALAEAQAETDAAAQATGRAQSTAEEPDDDVL